MSVLEPVSHPYAAPAFPGPVPASLHSGPVPVGGPVPTTVGQRKRKASDAAEGDDVRRTTAPAVPSLDGTYNALDQLSNAAALQALHMLPGQPNAHALQRHLAASNASLSSSDTDMPHSDHASDAPPPSLSGTRDTSSPASSMYDLPPTPSATSVDFYPTLARGRANGADRQGGTFCGLLGPAEGAPAADSMQLDDHDAGWQAPTDVSRHGPHCQDIAQLSVRHNPTTNTAELWATCPSCGAYTRVQEQSDVLPYAQYAS